MCPLSSLKIVGFNLSAKTSCYLEDWNLKKRTFSEESPSFLTATMTPFAELSKDFGENCSLIWYDVTKTEDNGEEE